MSETTESTTGESTAGESPDFSYTLSTRIEERKITGRDDAIKTAKDWSRDSGQSVLVERHDGKVKMSFRDGGLVDYVYETRKGRRV